MIAYPIGYPTGNPMHTPKGYPNRGRIAQFVSSRVVPSPLLVGHLSSCRPVRYPRTSRLAMMSEAKG